MSRDLHLAGVFQNRQKQTLLQFFTTEHALMDGHGSTLHTLLDELVIGLKEQQQQVQSG